jgi:hypothetical protein
MSEPQMMTHRKGRGRRAPRRLLARAARGRRKTVRQRAEKGLLSLMEIGRRTGISYPTLVRYVKLHGDRIPHVGKGRKRRFPARAVGVFTELRSQSRRGRRPRGAAAGGVAWASLEARLAKLEKATAELSRTLRAVARSLKKPLRVSVRR